MCSSERRDLIHKNSEVALARLRYSASVLEREMTACFLELHDTGELPKNQQNPEIERRSSGSLPQSASQNPVRRKQEDACK